MLFLSSILLSGIPVAQGGKVAGTSNVYLPLKIGALSKVLDHQIIKRYLVLGSWELEGNVELGSFH